jgi:DNA-binding MarR family transcriptional regulator
MCSDAGGTTIARIGRELGITRQGASKIVASLRDRRYVTVTPSATNGREKTVQLTSRATDYLAAHRETARRIEAGLRAELGPEVFNGVDRLLDALCADDSIRMSTGGSTAADSPAAVPTRSLGAVTGFVATDGPCAAHVAGASRRTLPAADCPTP